MNKLTAVSLASVAVLAAAGGSYVWAKHEGPVELQTAADQLRAQLGPNGAFSYASVVVHPFGRSADLSQVVLRTAANGLLTAEHVNLIGGLGKLDSMRATGLRMSGPAEGGSLTAASLSAKDIALLPAMPERSAEPTAAPTSSLCSRSSTGATGPSQA